MMNNSTLRVISWIMAGAFVSWATTILAGIEPAPFHGASNRVTLPPGNSGLNPQRAVFTMAQPLAAHARMGGGTSQVTSGMASAPSQVGIGFEYALQQASFCNCGCLADPACDGSTDILDVVGTVNVAFRNVAAYTMLDCQGLARTDTDCNGATDVIDVVHLVNVAFRNGNPATEFCAPCR